MIDILITGVAIIATYLLVALLAELNHQKELKRNKRYWENMKKLEALQNKQP